MNAKQPHTTEEASPDQAEEQQATSNQSSDKAQANQSEDERRKELRSLPPKKHGRSITIAPGNPATPDVFDTPPSRL